MGLRNLAFLLELRLEQLFGVAVDINRGGVVIHCRSVTDDRQLTHLINK